MARECTFDFYGLDTRIVSDHHPLKIETLNKSELFPDYVFVSTPWKQDPADDTRQAVDCGMYRKSLQPAPNAPPNSREKIFENRRINWSRVELTIECKVPQTSKDPFDESEPDNEATADERKKTLAQIFSYAALVFRHQQRTFHYMILFLGHYARVIRYDRAGVYTTTKYDYVQKGSQLVEFLLNFASSDRAGRGFDTTAHRIELTSDLGTNMRQWGQKQRGKDDYAQDMWNKSLDDKYPWWKLEVHTEDSGRRDSSDPSSGPSTAPAIRTFVVGKPHFQAPGLACRATRGYVALEVDTNDEPLGDFVYLKDAWRVVGKNIQKEGAVLELLKSHEVQYTPTPICHGDLPDQVTKSQAIWQETHTEGKCSMKTHQHYRLVVKEVGKPLAEFETGFQLILAIYCCVIGTSYHESSPIFSLTVIY